MALWKFGIARNGALRSKSNRRCTSGSWTQKCIAESQKSGTSDEHCSSCLLRSSGCTRRLRLSRARHFCIPLLLLLSSFSFSMYLLFLMPFSKLWFPQPCILSSPIMIYHCLSRNLADSMHWRRDRKMNGLSDRCKCLFCRKSCQFLDFRQIWICDHCCHHVWRSETVWVTIYDSSGYCCRPGDLANGSDYLHRQYHPAHLEFAYLRVLQSY